MRKPILISVILVLIVAMVLLYKFYAPSGSLSFDEIAPGEVVKIEYRHGGNGLLYVTQDKIEIHQFIQSLRATRYRKTKPNPWSGGGSLLLYDRENKEIAGLAYGPNQLITINEGYYQMTSDIHDQLKPFFNALLIDKNVAKGK